MRAREFIKEQRPSRTKQVLSDSQRPVLPKEGRYLSPGNTVGFNVFEIPPEERAALNGKTVYHQTRKLAQILKSGALKPRADASGATSFAINTMRAGRDFQAPKGIFVSRGPNGWYGDDIAFKILPSDKIYRAYGPTGHLLITNPIPVSRFLDLSNKIDESLLMEYERSRAKQALGDGLWQNVKTPIDNPLFNAII